MTFPRTPILPSLLLASFSLFACSSDPESPGPQGGAGGVGAGTGGTSAGSGGTPQGGSTGGAGAGGAAGGTGGAGGSAMPAGLPASTSDADLTAFLMSGTYRNAPWRAETAATRDSPSASPHSGKVQIWMNPPLIDSLKNGRNGATTAAPKPDAFSMAVKELYDEAGTTVVGRALVYRSGTSTEASAWISACISSAPERCAIQGASANVLAVSRGASGAGCYFCHSPSLQAFYTMPPP